MLWRTNVPVPSVITATPGCVLHDHGHPHREDLAVAGREGGAAANHLCAAVCAFDLFTLLSARLAPWHAAIMQAQGVSHEPVQGPQTSTRMKSRSED